MANQKLLEVFLNTKKILCTSDYYTIYQKDYSCDKFRKYDTTFDGDTVYRQTGYVYRRQRCIYD